MYRNSEIIFPKYIILLEKNYFVVCRVRSVNVKLLLLLFLLFFSCVFEHGQRKEFAYLLDTICSTLFTRQNVTLTLTHTRKGKKYKTFRVAFASRLMLSETLSDSRRYGPVLNIISFDLCRGLLVRFYRERNTWFAFKGKGRILAVVNFRRRINIWFTRVNMDTD